MDTPQTIQGHDDGSYTIDGVDYVEGTRPRPKFVKGMVVRAKEPYTRAIFDGGYGIVLKVEDDGALRVRHSNSSDVDSYWRAESFHPIDIIIDPRDDDGVKSAVDSTDFAVGDIVEVVYDGLSMSRWHGVVTGVGTKTTVEFGVDLYKNVTKTSFSFGRPDCLKLVRRHSS